MRAVVQRVSRASVSVGRERVASTGPGFVILVGVSTEDTDSDADALTEKLLGLRIFADQEQKMNRSIRDVGGEVLVVSQFTLQGDVRRGRRPSFTRAAAPARAKPLVDRLVERLRAGGVSVAEGRFGAFMKVELINDGPVTIVVDVEDGKVV